MIARVLALADRDLALSLVSVPALLFHDVAVAVVFWMLDRVTGRPKWLWGLYAALAVYIAINVPVIRALSSPLTMPMLRAAGGPLLDSIAYYATAANLLRMGVVLTAAAVLPLVIASVPKRLRAVVVVTAVVLAAAGPWSLTRAETLGLHRNAVTAIVATALPRVTGRPGATDWRVSPFESSMGPALPVLQGRAAGHHVLVVVLESAGAQYLAPYGGADDPMPHLSALAGEALVFEHAYASYPESIKGLFAMMCARDPGFDVTAEAHAAAACTPLPETLRAAGYRTAVFHSGRFAYLGMQSIVDRLGFDVQEDAGAIGGNVQSSFGVDEPATVSRILAWIDRLAAGQRFFINYLPVAGHHPYAVPERGPFTGGDDLAAYKNALHFGDRALADLLTGLKTRGLSDRTLVVIVGDHGEAFGQHPGNFGHTQFIYEENVRVPLIIAGAGVSGLAPRVVSMIDIAPTVLDLLGLPRSERHEGESVLAPGARMALFFTDYALGWLGLRDGCWKYMFAIETRRSQLFDLCRDPQERVDRAEGEAVRVAAYRAHVQAWIAARRAGILAR